MKRVIVIGSPGSGKSTFSRALHEKTGLPLHHLDMMLWKPDKATIEDRGRFYVLTANGIITVILSGMERSGMKSKDLTG